MAPFAAKGGSQLRAAVDCRKDGLDTISLAVADACRCAAMTTFQTPSMLTLGAIGDSYGFCFEFAEPEFVAQHNDLEYIQHPEFGHITPGAYSDDTQMQLALAELIVSDLEWTPISIADQFVSSYKRDPRPGYARRFRALLEEVDDGSELIAKIQPNSDRNGAAMRAPIIGLFPDLQTVRHLATLQAAVTHNTKGGIDSAVAAALMSHYLLYGLGEKTALPEFLTQTLPDYNWTERWQGKVPIHGISTVQAALTALLASDSLSEILQACVAFTGDVDSVAAIACSCAAISDSICQDIPEQLWQGLERTRYGLPYLQEMDRRVWQHVVTTTA